MTDERAGVLVVGAGQAATQFACSLRDGGYDRAVTLVGDDARAPYQRPPLSKGFLRGAVDAAGLALRHRDYYIENRIELLLGERVVAIEMAASGSGVATTASGRRLPFSRLVLATGAAASRLDIQGVDAGGVHVLRSIEDALALSAALERARDVVVVGGGFVGLEVAATAASLGKVVTVLEAAPVLLERAVGPGIAAHVLAAHCAAGLHIRLAVAPRRIRVADGRVSGVALADGSVIPAQAVVVGIGAAPRTELAEQLGLACDRGVLVDAFTRTSDGVTLAIGDCARAPDPTPDARDTSRLRLESVDNAVEQAKVAAATVLGRMQPYSGQPWFWSDQGGYKLQIAGLKRPTDTAVTRRYDDVGKILVGYYRHGRLVAVEAANAPADFVIVKKALTTRFSFDPLDLADASVSLKVLLKERTSRGVAIG